MPVQSGLPGYSFNSSSPFKSTYFISQPNFNGGESNAYINYSVLIPFTSPYATDSRS